ncbi:hypothetical protein LIER_24084 [Lithospermum erythrorhizon]|uniref:GAG-pre-integrase domain-containing protein n=1 Tax=Lithospermum erythrorhizon TaxID=34254 RepID=A0AAV3R221_LITER
MVCRSESPPSDATVRCRRVAGVFRARFRLRFSLVFLGRLALVSKVTEQSQIVPSPLIVQSPGPHATQKTEYRHPHGANTNGIDVVCHYCHKPGHLKRHYRKLQNNNRRTSSTHVASSTSYLTVKEIIGKGYESRGLYMLDVSKYIPLACSSVSSSYEAHCRLGHPSLSSLKKLCPQFNFVSALDFKSVVEAPHNSVTPSVSLPHTGASSIPEASVSSSLEPFANVYMRRKLNNVHNPPVADSCPTPSSKSQDPALR